MLGRKRTCVMMDGRVRMTWLCFFFPYTLPPLPLVYFTEQGDVKKLGYPVKLPYHPVPYFDSQNTNNCFHAIANHLQV